MTARHPIFFIWSPDYTHLSSGVRCLFLLCHHLNQLGFEAYITGRNAPPHLAAPHADAALIEAKRGAEDIVVYPEIVNGNPLHGRRVVRYLLNKPGALSDVIPEYSPDDYFMYFAPEFRPDGVASRKLRIPTLDSHYFHQREPARPRHGFVIYAARARPELASLPAWVQPRTLVTSDAPRTPAELGDIYRASRALVTWERTAAITEAMHCGCPTIIIPNPDFDHAPLIRRNLGCGIVIGWKHSRLRLAQWTTQVGRIAYRLRAGGVSRRVRGFATDALAHFERRDAMLRDVKPPV